MPSLTLKYIPTPLMERLRARAAQNQRSLNREVIWLFDQVATTWITACEIAYGAASFRYPEQNQKLVTEFLSTLPILDLSLPSAMLFGQYKARLRHNGATARLSPMRT